MALDFLNDTKYSKDDFMNFINITEKLKKNSLYRGNNERDHFR